MDALGSSIALLILFSCAVQMAEGSTYVLVPSVQPERKGAVSGIVGAGGNLGGVCWAMLFQFISKEYDINFRYIGIIVMVFSLLTPFLKLEGYRANEFFVRTDIPDGAVPNSEKDE
jgi:MFS transporter, NNP family, nitrate/nitrite transporter